MTVRDLEGVVENTLIDRMMFGDVIDKSSKLQELSSMLSSAGIQRGDSMMFDLWSSLYKVAPKIKDEVPSELALNKGLLENIATRQEWANLKRSCQLDEITSAIGTLKLGGDVSSLLKEKKQSSKSYKKAADKAQEASDLQGLKDTLESLAESTALDGDNTNIANIAQAALIQSVGTTQIDGRTLNAVQNRLEISGIEDAISYLAKRAKKVEADAVGAASEAMEELKNGLGDVLKQVAQETESLSDALKQYHGWDRSTGVGAKINPEEAFKAAEMMLSHRECQKIREIAVLAGKMSNISLRKKRGKVDVPVMEQWSGVTEGRDISKLLPQELVALKNPTLRSDFLKRFADGKLLQYEVDPRQNAGKGPLVVCIDESGSMNGQREVWAKAVALSLLKIAQKERRPYALVKFASKAKEPEYFHPKKRVDPSRIMEIFSYLIGGGTDFCEPLKKAMNVIENGKGFKKSDIVFITDGEARIDFDFLQLFNAKKEKHKTSVMTVLIGPSARGVDDFSDHIYRTRAVAAEDGAEVLSVFKDREK